MGECVSAEGMASAGGGGNDVGGALHSILSSTEKCHSQAEDEDD